MNKLLEKFKLLGCKFIEVESINKDILEISNINDVIEQNLINENTIIFFEEIPVSIFNLFAFDDLTKHYSSDYDLDIEDFDFNNLIEIFNQNNHTNLTQDTILTVFIQFNLDAQPVYNQIDIEFFDSYSEFICQSIEKYKIKKMNSYDKEQEKEIKKINLVKERVINLIENIDFLKLSSETSMIQFAFNNVIDVNLISEIELKREMRKVRAEMVIRGLNKWKVK